MSKQDRMEFIAHMQETAQAQLMPLRGRLERAGIDLKPGWRTEIERLEAEAAVLRRERDELAARLAKIEAQKPVAFFRLSDAEWLDIGRPAIVYKTADGDWREPLYSYPTPAAAPERAERLSEIERWKRIAENAQAVTAGGNDKLDYFEVPAHLMAALALALDEWPGAQGQAGAASMGIADGTKIRPAAAPERAEPADPQTPPPGCRLLAPARPCRCSQDGCSDSTSCPRGER